MPKTIQLGGVALAMAFMIGQEPMVVQEPDPLDAGDFAITMMTENAVLEFPYVGAVRGSGESCQVLRTTGSIFMIGAMTMMPTIEWTSADDLDDGMYVGMLRVEGGQVVPCAPP